MRAAGVCNCLKLKLCDVFNESLALEERLKKGHELCEGLENAAADKDVQDLTMNIYEKVNKFLTSTEPHNLQESATQRLRKLCLEIFQKLPNGDHLRPYACPILSLLFKLVEVENEDNVLICVKLIIDLHKYYRPPFSSDVTCFLSFVRRVYRGLQNEAVNIFEPQPKIEIQSISDLHIATAVQKAFTVTKVYTQESEDDGSLKTYHILPKSCFSLKVMQEIPILVVLMYQLFKQHIHQDVSEFIPLIMGFINLHPTEEQKSSALFNQDIFIDFMAAQVKTLSFLAYVIKIYQDLVERYSSSLVQGMMNLLVNCPPSVTNMRKEFFIAARHILGAQEIRPKFLDVLDDLMNEDILIGQGYTVRDALRPLAYSTLADLTHHIRSELSLAKIARAIDLYGRNMHDDTLPFSIQHMSLRLLLNLVECVRQRVLASVNNPNGPGADELNTGVSSGTARRLLLQTLRLCVLKCRVVAEHYLPMLEATCIPESPEDSEVATGAKQRSATPFMFSQPTNLVGTDQSESTLTFDKSSTDLLKSAKSSEDVNKFSAPRIIDSMTSRPQLSHLDLRSLTKLLMSGMRTIVTGMIQCPHEPGFGQTMGDSGSAGQTDRSKLSKPPPTSSGLASASSAQLANRFLTPDELMVLSDYFNYGMRMIDIVQIVVRDGKQLYTKCQPGTKSPDEKILIETFALTFAQLSPVSFREIFSSKIHDFVVWCRRSPSYTNMALHLLSHLNKTSCFGHILLSYLVDRLERLGDGTDESVLYMRLLKLCFTSVNMTGTENEHVMKLHLRRIVQGSMQYCLTAKEPTAYLTLLRMLFRSIGGGAHDKLYREFFPLLPEMLSTLNRLLRSPHRANARDLLGELCVIVPVRLSTLLPYLSLLMEPLVYVLNCNTVNQGLRTLELCVDNMQPDFLHDHLHQVRGDMLLALYNSLHSSSEYVQKMSFKVLGKLGRFNRTNLLEVQRLRLDPGEGEAGPSLRFYLNEFRTQPIDLPIRSLVDAAIEALQDVNVDLATKTRAWELLQSVCLAALDLTSAFLWTNKTGSPVESIYAYLEGSAFLTAVNRFVETVSLGSDANDWSGCQLVQHTCCVDGDLDRNVMVRVLAGLFLAGLTKPLRDSHADFIGFVVRHLTIISITQFLLQPSSSAFQSDDHLQGSRSVVPMELEESDGPQHSAQSDTRQKASSGQPSTPWPVDLVSERYRVGYEACSPALAHLVRSQGSRVASKLSLDPVLLVDALQMIMGHEDKQLTRPISVLLQIMHGTASTVLRGALDSATNQPETQEDHVQRAVAQLPLFAHLGHVLIDMLHHPAWYVKWGGCATVIYLTGLLHTSWLQIHFLPLLRGLLHCIHDLSSQMSQGALSMARDCSRLLIQTVFNQPVAPGVTLEPATNNNEDDNSSNPKSGTPGDEEDVGRPTSGKRSGVLGKRRPSTASNTTTRRAGSLRRGRSASISSNTSTNEAEEDGTTVMVDVSESSTTGVESGRSEILDQGKHSESNSTYSLLSLLTNVINELLDALLSETAAVREEARCLLRLLSHQLGRPLAVLLAPYWRQRLGHILPPQPPLRLPDLPISTQLVVLEANYFFGQSENGRSKSRGTGGVMTTSGSAAGFDLHSGGAELLRYDVANKADRLFLIDVRALLTQPDPLNGSPSGAASSADPTATGTGSAGTTNPAPGQTSSGAGGGGRPATAGPCRSTSQPAVHRLRLIDLRVAACRVLSLTHYLTAQKMQNLSTLFKGICSEQEAIHEAAFACLKEFVSHTSIDIELRHANVKPILQNVRQTTNLRLNTARQLSYCAQLFPSTFSERLCDAIYSHLNALIDNLPSQQNVSSISTLTPPSLELCAVLVDLFHLIPLATAKHVSSLIDLVVRAERSLNIEPTSPLRLPLVRFLARYPAETCMHLLTGSKWPYDSLAHRIFLYVLKSPQGQSVTDYLKTNYHILCDLIRPTDLAEQKPSAISSARFWLPRIGTPLTAACPRHLAIRAVHTIHQLFPTWLLHGPSSGGGASGSSHTGESPKSAKSRYKTMCSPTSSKSTYHPVCAALLAYWRSDAFAQRQASLTLVTLSSFPDGTADPNGLCGVEYVESEPRVSPVLAASENSVVPELTLPSGEAVPMIASGTGNFEHWDEPRLILDCLLDCAKVDVENFDLLFVIVIGVNRLRSVAGLYPLRCFLDNLIKEAPVPGWHRRLFLHFVTLVRHRLSTLVDASSTVDQSSLVVFGGNTTVTVEDMYRLMAHLILPSLAYALEHGPLEELIGGPARPFEDNEADLVYLFINVLLDDSVLQVCTELRVMYYQLACLFVHYATDYIHTGSDVDHSPRLRRLIDFAWACTTSSLSVVDLQEKYTGLQLLAHLIAKFQLPTRIAVQVFQCLAKGTHTETKKIVNPALDVLIPAWVQGPEDQKVLASTTRKIILEDHGIQSCIHIIGIIVRHADLYYPIRHQLLSHIIIIISRLSTQQLPVEQRRLALDMIDTAAQWDYRCRQTLIETASAEPGTSATNSVPPEESPMDSSTDGDDTTSTQQLSTVAGTTAVPVSTAPITSENTPMSKTHRDQLLNLMIRFACQAVDSSQNGNLSEASVTRALSQLEFALRSDVWGGEACELRLSFIDRYFTTDEAMTASTPSSSPAVVVTPSNATSTAAAAGSGAAVAQSASHAGAGAGVSTAGSSGGPSGTAQSTHSGAPGLGTTQTNNMLMTLEVLRILFTSLESPTLLSNVKHFSGGLCSLLTRQLNNVRLIRSCANLLRAMLERFPADASHRQKITAQAELFDIYSTVSKAIQESFSLYSENGPKSTLLARLQSAFLLFQATQVQSNPHAFVDRCIVQLVKLTHRLIQDVITPAFGSNAPDSGASAQLTDLLITGLEVIKSRLNVVSHEMRKNAFGPDLCVIMDRARDPRLFRAVIKILRDWINVPKSEEHFAPTAREKVNFFHRLWLAYPRWVDTAPEIAREILECVYEVYSSGSLFKNHDLYVKLEQAFCCSMLAPFPEIRERFVSLYLDASQLYSAPQQPQQTAAGKPSSQQHQQQQQRSDSVGSSIAGDATCGDPLLEQPRSSTSCSSPLQQTDADKESGSSSCSGGGGGDVHDDAQRTSTGSTAVLSPTTASSSLLVRLLFLYVSCCWDEAHFRDGFWLPLFFDILLCDVDTSLPPLLSASSSLFPIPPCVRETELSADSAFGPTAQLELTKLLELQIKGSQEASKVTFKNGLRGLLCLVHRHPALATQMMSQLWPQLWNRLLLRQPDPNTDPSAAGASVPGNSSLLNRNAPFGEDSARFGKSTGAVTDTAVYGGSADAAAPAVAGTATNGGSTLTGHTNLSVNEIRCFSLPPLWRFLASDQHVNPAEPQPSALGAFLACLATTPDTVLIHLPLPIITYIGTSYNQWHSVALFLESLCARTRKANTESNGTTATTNDFVYNVNLPTPDSDSSPSITLVQPSELPSGTATLSLISVYDGMNEPDYLSAAWWYRLTALNGSANRRYPTGMLKCIEYAQHGLLLRALEISLDQLASTTSALGSGPTGTSLGSGSAAIAESGATGGSASSNRAAALAASTASAVARSQTASPLTLASASAQFSDYLNRSKLQDYCIRYLKQLGQWDSLETLASNVQTGSYMSTPFGATGSSSCGTGSGASAGTTAGSLAGSGSVYWGLKADAAWRRSDWSEVYASLSRLANESPRSDLCRYALIQGAACVAGRRTTSGFAAAVAAAAAASSTAGSASSTGADSDPYATSSVGDGSTASGGSSTPGSNSGVVSSSAGVTAPSSSSSPSGSSSSNTAVNSVVSMIQTSETESHRIMSAVLREWRRMPLIVTSQHVPMLQIAHRAVEITEGNSLLAQYCGHVLAGPCLGQPGSSYASPGQSGTGSSGAGQSSTGATATSTSTASGALRMPLSQALHDYKTVFKWWQSRPPSIGDDLGFWHDLFSWRQVVEEGIITCQSHLQKFGPERANLIAVCQRELALCQLQLARGARKYRFPSIAQQHLDRYTRMNLPPLFEKTKQEIKLKMAELRKDELLEGLELMEKTNIQRYEKKDRAKFFCYKAVFFSHFNKGDEATKNFGYATQMQDNIHKVWSIYGDFLENVYSSYPAAKREVAVSTTGIFAMQALMEAASVAGGLERRSRADLAKSLWLLTLDDTKGQQRLARTFEERASRVRPDAFLPWLPSLVTTLLRPEGRFIVPALRGVTATHPTVLYSLLRGLQHQLATEVSCDERLGELVQLAESEPPGSFAHLLQARVRSALGSQAEDAEQRKLARVASAAPTAGELGRTGAKQIDMSVTAGTGRGSAFGSTDLSTIPGGSAGGSGGGLNAFPAATQVSSKKKKRVIVVMRGVEGERLSGGSPLSPDHQSQQQQLQTKRGSKDDGDVQEEATSVPGTSKKTVIVAMHDHSSGLTSSDDPVEDVDEFDVDDDTEDGELDDEETERADTHCSGTNEGGTASGSSLAPDTVSGSSVVCDPDAATGHELGADQGTGCLSSSVTDGLHRVNLLMNQIRRRHAARIYAIDLFTAEVGGRLQPSWLEQLLTRLCAVLDYLQRLAWTRISSGRHYRPSSIERSRVPDWLLLELRIELATACGLPVRSQSGWSKLMEMNQSGSACHPAERNPVVAERRRKRDSSSSSSSSSCEFSDKEEEVKKPARSGRKQQLGTDSTRPSNSANLTTQKSAQEQPGIKRPAATATSAAKRALPPRTAPAFAEVTQLAAERVCIDIQRDPSFVPIHHQLLKALDDWENRSILYVMQQLTRRWIPLLEERVARLPTRMHLSDCGARRLIELPSLVVTANHTSVAPTSASGLGSSAAPSTVLLPSVPCLELPGESGLLQSTGGFLNSGAFPYPSTHHGPSTPSTGPNLALHLVIAEVFPHVARVRCAPGRLGPPARRLGIRASNGRVFYYDLPALGYWSPVHSLGTSAANATAIQLMAAAGARTHSLLPSHAKGRASNVGQLTLDGLCPAPYTGWRHTGPLHLFQMINDILAGQPETAKRRLALFTPRMMEVGPVGLYLTEASASAPAASVGVASAHPLPSANPVTSVGLTALARPPPIVGTGPVTGSSGLIATGQKPSPGSDNVATPPWAVSFARTEQTASNSDAKIKPSLPAPPPGPLPALVSTPNSSGSSSLASNLSVGGSAAVAAEAIGRPTGLDAGCHPACCSLTAVLEQACASWFQRRKGAGSTDQRTDAASDLYAGSRELVCLFYELLLLSVSVPPHQQPQGRVTVPMLCKLFTDLSHRIPPAPFLKNALVSTLGLLSESDGSVDSTTEIASEFPRGSLIRRWAAGRMLDAESYWLFRHNLASHLGLIGLMEQLFHLTPSHPACLLMDPRSGRAESRHTRFTLPTFTGPPTTADGTGHQTTAVSLLVSSFAMAMGLRSPRPVVADGSALTTMKQSSQGENPPPSEENDRQNANTNSSTWTHHPSPVPFRLTPHLAGFICLPGAAAHVGPFAISLTTAAQALSAAQRTQSLTSLYRTLIRGDYILWHRGRQAAVYAFQLLSGESNNLDQNTDSESDTDTETGGGGGTTASAAGSSGGHKLKTKLFNELGVKAVGSANARMDKLPPSGQEQRQQPQHPSSGCVMLPELSNEQLIQLITLTLDAMNTNLKSLSDYSTSEPGTWSSITAATNPSNLAQMDPAYLPWL